MALDGPKGPEDFTRKCADSGKILGVESISSEEVEERLLSESLLREATPPPMWSRPVILLAANISMWQAHFDTCKNTFTINIGKNSFELQYRYRQRFEFRVVVLCRRVPRIVLTNVLSAESQGQG